MISLASNPEEFVLAEISLKIPKYNLYQYWCVGEPRAAAGPATGEAPKTRAGSEDMVEVLRRAGQRPVGLGIAEGCDQTDAEEESQS